MAAEWVPGSIAGDSTSRHGPERRPTVHPFLWHLPESRRSPPVSTPKNCPSCPSRVPLIPPPPSSPFQGGRQSEAMQGDSSAPRPRISDGADEGKGDGRAKRCRGIPRHLDPAFRTEPTRERGMAERSNAGDRRARAHVPAVSHSRARKARYPPLAHCVRPSPLKGGRCFSSPSPPRPPFKGDGRAKRCRGIPRHLDPAFRTELTRERGTAERSDAGGFLCEESRPGRFPLSCSRARMPPWLTAFARPP